MPHRLHEQLPGKNPHHDRWQSVQDVSEEAHRGREHRHPLLGEIESRADPDRQSNTARDSDDNECADDRVRHAAAAFAGWTLHLGKERPIHGGSAKTNQVNDDEEQR